MNKKNKIGLLALGMVSLLATTGPNSADADSRSRHRDAVRHGNTNRAELHRDRAELRRDLGELRRDRADLHRLYRSGASRGDIVRKREEIRRDIGEVRQGRREIREDFGQLRRDGWHRNSYGNHSDRYANSGGWRLGNSDSWNRGNNHWDRGRWGE